MNDSYRDPRHLTLDFIALEGDVEAAKSSLPPTSPGLGDHSRRLARVQVSLPVSVVIDQNLVIESFTRDISESGLLLRGYHGPAIQCGTFVNVMLRGVISDDDSSDSAGVFSMEVVRSEGDLLALRFGT
jgi:PilZ domain